MTTFDFATLLSDIDEEFIDEYQNDFVSDEIKNDNNDLEQCENNK